MLTAECLNASALVQNLLPGRQCSYHFQCRSALCKESVCFGNEKFTSCAVNEDCGAGMYCRTATAWPYAS